MSSMRRIAGWIAGTALMLAVAACSKSATDGDGEVPPVWTEAFPAADVGWFLSAWGPSADDLYAVGGAPEEGVVMQFDGASWNQVDLGLDVPLLNWCFGFGPDDVFFAGSNGTILHFDGAKFTKMDTPTDQTLWGVWGAAPDDVWAVGGQGHTDQDPTILHFDGHNWTKSSTPTASHPNVFAYFKVWGTASNNVYAVGQRGVLAHWDGSTWTAIESGTNEDLISLWGTGPDRIAVIGGRDNGHVVTFDGSTWRHQSLAPLPGLNGVWMGDPNTAHIGGDQGTLAKLDFDTLSVTEEESPTFLTVHALFGTTGRLYAVGGSLLDVRPPNIGVALTRETRPGD